MKMPVLSAIVGCDDEVCVSHVDVCAYRECAEIAVELPGDSDLPTDVCEVDSEEGDEPIGRYCSEKDSRFVCVEGHIVTIVVECIVTVD